MQGCGSRGPAREIATRGRRLPLRRVARARWSSSSPWSPSSSAAPSSGSSPRRATPVRGAAPRAEGRDGAPPLSLDLGVRTDPEAVDLRKALALYDAGQARRGRSSSSRGTTRSRRASARRSHLAGRHGRPDDPALGAPPEERRRPAQPRRRALLVRRGRREDAWQSAASLEPDTAYAVAAGNLLHPEFARNLPIFVPTTDGAERRSQARRAGAARAAPASRAAGRSPTSSSTASRCSGSASSARRSASIAAAREGARGRRGAGRRGRRPLRQGAPGGGVLPARPAHARRFPKAATVRFHLGLLLLWSGEVKEARRQLELVRTVEPGSPLVGRRGQYLDRLRKAGV